LINLILKQVYINYYREPKDFGNISDTRNQTSATNKYFSSGIKDSNKDIEIEDQNDENYQTFKVSPVKIMGDDSQIPSTNNFEKYEINEDEKIKEIEDSSMFGLTPTPKPDTKEKSRTSHVNK
jgi:hypothetical protein